MPYIMQIANGEGPHSNVYGSDYDTPDWSGVRDYIEVAGLAGGGLSALVHLKDHTGLGVVNLGTGCGFIVFEVISTSANTTGIHISYKLVPRWVGEVESSFASPAEFEKLLDGALRKVSKKCVRAPGVFIRTQ